VQLVGALFAVRPEESMDGLLTFVLEGLLLYVLVTNAVRTPAVLRQVLWSLLAAGAAMGALALYQQLSGSFDSNFGGFARIDEGAKGFVVGAVDDMRQKRLGGPLGMPNRFAQIMAVLMPIALFQIHASRSRAAKLLAGAALALVAIGCALGFSRGAFVALALVSPAILILSRVRVRHLLVAAAGIACLGLLVPQYLVRLASLSTVADLASEAGGPGLEGADSSVRGRITEMVAAVLMFADHPVVGVGPDMYPENYNEYARVAGGRVRDGTREAHSMPLHIGAENGMLGLAAFGAVIWVTLRDLVRARRRAAARQPELERLVTGVLLGLLVYLAAALFLHASYIRYLWFLLGLAAATARVASDADATAARRLVRLVRVRAAGPPARPA
jgi:putative inorganic carbon (HCO3(-)) transporter